MGRTAYGVRGITLRDDDYVVAMQVVKSSGALLTVTEQGFGKRTEIDEYRVQSRGGIGIINIATSDRNGLVVGVAFVEDGDELLLITQEGMILRMETAARAIGRARRRQQSTSRQQSGRQAGRKEGPASRAGGNPGCSFVITSRPSLSSWRAEAHVSTFDS